MSFRSWLGRLHYPRQMLEIRMAELGGEVGAEDRARLVHDIFDERFLLKRPLLLALEQDPSGPPVLLIDEIDWAPPSRRWCRRRWPESRWDRLIRC